MLGAGSAGIGVCEQIVRSMMADGLSEQGARAKICVVDINGLLTTDRADLDPAQRRLAQAAAAVPSREPGRPAGLTDVIDAVHPTALIGLSTAAGAFTEDVVRRIAAYAKRPIIMPLSNPTSRSEARPQDLADWTEGRALVAAGSPFPPMRLGDAGIPVAQCNNIYIFPGVGLAVTAVQATRVTDAMMTAAADARQRRRHDPPRPARDTAARPRPSRRHRDRCGQRGRQGRSRRCRRARAHRRPGRPGHPPHQVATSLSVLSASVLIDARDPLSGTRRTSPSAHTRHRRPAVHNPANEATRTSS
jgi:malic enzyme